MPEAPPLVAIVDDHTSMREATSNLLRSAGWSTATFADAESFLRSPQRHSAACVITDVRMPGITGLEMYEALVACGQRIPAVLMTAYLDDSVRARASKLGIVCCLGKPFAPEELIHCVRHALAKSRVEGTAR